MRRTCWHPEGLNIAFADGIPLLALPLKALRDLLPDGFHGIGRWYGLAWLMERLLQCWCLRGAGEKRLISAIAVAVAALAMPAFINRFGHAALTGHFTLLVGLGLYLRLARDSSVALWRSRCWLRSARCWCIRIWRRWCWRCWGAVPLTLLLRGDRRWIGAGLGVVACAGTVGLAMAGFGYLGAKGDGGYGLFAMNLLSPVWPVLLCILAGPWSRRSMRPGMVAGEATTGSASGWRRGWLWCCCCPGGNCGAWCGAMPGWRWCCWG